MNLLYLSLSNEALYIAFHGPIQAENLGQTISSGLDIESPRGFMRSDATLDLFEQKNCHVKIRVSEIT